MSGRNISRRLELAFFIAGSAAAVLCCWLLLPAALTRVRAGQQPQVSAAGADADVIPRDTLAAAYAGTTATVTESSTIGSVDIPALRISAPVVEGVSETDLRKGVGHVPGSALGGGLGNVVLAAHRDGIFRPLRSIRPGMQIRLAGKDGTYRYQVDSTQIVTPDHLEVMQIAEQPSMTLITCYPFDYIGSAPKRFVVSAHLISLVPDAAGPASEP